MRRLNHASSRPFCADLQEGVDPFDQALHPNSALQKYLQQADRFDEGDRFHVSVQVISWLQYHQIAKVASPKRTNLSASGCSHDLLSAEAGLTDLARWTTLPEELIDIRD